MSLTKKQKKYLKKYLKKKSLEEIAVDLNISQKEILEFLESQWRPQKYKKFLKKISSSSQEQKESPQKLRKWIIKNKVFLIFLTLSVLAVYVNSLGNEFVSDDISGILQNPHLDEIKYILNNRFSFFYAFIHYSINKLFGRTPLFFRLVNILSHLGTTLTLYFLLNLFNLDRQVALFATSIFAVHPILTESVTWISGGYYSYSAFLVLLSLSSYIFSSRYKKRVIYLLAILFYFLALATSEKVIAFPFILLFYEFCFGHLRKNWKKLIPFFVLSSLWGFYLIQAARMRATTLRKSFYQSPPQIESSSQRAISFVRLLSVAITSYLGLIFWPDKLTLYHSEMSFTPAEYLIKFFILFIILLATAYFYPKDRRIFFWLSFFFIALSPTLAPFGLSWVVAERYVYLASIGIFVVIALALQKLAQIFKNQRPSYLLLAIILLSLSIRTIIRNADWRNQDTLWLATAKTSPSSPQNHNNLGDYYARQGNLPQAVEEFKKAIELKPNYGDAYHNLANTYFQMGKDELAIENYQKALIFNPHLWQSHQNLAAIFFKEKKYDLALEELKKAIAINSENANLYLNLAVVHLQLKQKSEAQKALKKALQLDPQNQKVKQLWLTISSESEK